MVNNGNPCLMLRAQSYRFMNMPITYTSSPGLAISTLSPYTIIYLFLGILPGRTSDGDY